MRDSNLQIELIAKCGLDWKGLKRLFKIRSVATCTVDVLGRNYDGATPIRQEVGFVCDNIKSSSLKAFDH